MAIPELLSSTEFVSAIVGAVVGSLGAGVVSFLLQRVATREATKAGSDERHQAETVLARSLMIKIIRIHSDLEGLHDNLCKAAIKAEVKGTVVSGAFEPIANPTPPIYIQPDELALLLPLSDDRMTNIVLSLDVCRNSAFDILKVYETKRNALQATFKDVRVADDGAAVIVSSDPKLKLDAAALERLVSNLIEHTADYLDDAESALYGVHRLLSEKYKLGFSIGEPKRARLGPQEAE